MHSCRCRVYVISPKQSEQTDNIVSGCIVACCVKNIHLCFCFSFPFFACVCRRCRCGSYSVRCDAMRSLFYSPLLSYIIYIIHYPKETQSRKLLRNVHCLRRLGCLRTNLVHTLPGALCDLVEWSPRTVNQFVGASRRRLGNALDLGVD